MPRNAKRLRIIAGPNGSGKSTFINALREKYDCGVYINTDDIETTLRKANRITLSDYKITTSQEDFEAFLQLPHSLSLIEKAHQENVNIHVQLQGDKIVTGESTNSYEAALVGEFIKNRLIAGGFKFTFETVMSYTGKVDFVKSAIASGYKVYLYFITTESVEINILRVKQRVGKKGHDVAEDRIRSRYKNTMELLKEVIPLTYRSYLFDNSSQDNPIRPIAEIVGESLTIKTAEIPVWLEEYVLKPMNFI